MTCICRHSSSDPKRTVLCVQLLRPPPPPPPHPCLLTPQPVPSLWPMRRREVVCSYTYTPWCTIWSNQKQPKNNNNTFYGNQPIRDLPTQ